MNGHENTSLLGSEILVVDDEPDAANLLALLLSVWGYQTRVATDGRSALAAIDRLLPQLVLLDIGLPDADGCDIARKLRRDRGLSSDRCKLVALTGHTRSKDIMRTREAGFDDFLAKPVDFSKLRMILAQLHASRSVNDKSQLADSQPPPRELQN